MLSFFKKAGNNYYLYSENFRVLNEQSIRQNKISRLIQKELSIVFQTENQNLFPGSMITVTIVRVSPDLGVAKVYLSVFTTGQKEKLFTDIQAKATHIRHALAKKIKNQVKRIPELQFIEDDSLDYYNNIDRILSKE